jgi:hypothetical protein
LESVPRSAATAPRAVKLSPVSITVALPAASFVLANTLYAAEPALATSKTALTLWQNYGTEKNAVATTNLVRAFEKANLSITIKIVAQCGTSYFAQLQAASISGDADGGLLISCYQPNQLWRWTKETGLELVFDEWTGEFILSPTNIACYGDNLDRLALALLYGHDLMTIELPYRRAAIRRPILRNELS